MTALYQFFSFLSNMIQHFLDVLLPPRCLLCDEAVASQDALCSACWKKMTFIVPPCCARCGMPFDLPVDEGTLCGACLAAPPIFDWARSALVYDDASRALILRFKHADRTHVATGLALWMYRAGGAALGDRVDIIVPIPLHWWRLLARRYNQAALLAQALGKLLGKPVDPLCLRRVRATPPQGHLGVKSRAKNVQGAFALAKGAQEKLAGKTVLLIDDVLTTGATVGETAKVLKAAGVRSVVVLTLARVKKAD